MTEFSQPHLEIAGHTLKRFLVVGCGGSGGATLAYLMDQLRSMLAVHGITQLPAGWQFVNIDVPITPDSAPDGLRNVQDQGGTYVGLGVVAGTYADLDATVSDSLAAHRELQTIATWTPEEPENVLVPIALGAGQYRAIGRMITISKLGTLTDQLTSAWGRLQSNEAHGDMAQLGSLGRHDPNEAPLVLVVSSMAGGAGASMALDVCRVLSSIPGVPTGSIAVFMVGSDVFFGLPEDARSGVMANSLAMLGEIVAVQTGAGLADDQELYRTLGVAGGTLARVPFGRVFPVNLHAGTTRRQFGDGTPKAVYRGLARGLAGLMTSPTASHEFAAYDLTNTQPIPIARSLYGWGGRDDQLVWGSFGFASLSLGRERYAEFAAQRLSRNAVDRLLEGHLTSGNTDAGTEQLNALVAAQFPAVVRELALYTPGESFAGWLTTTLWPDHQASAEYRGVVTRHIDPVLPDADGQDAAQWRERLGVFLRGARSSLVTDTKARAYSWAVGYHRELFNRTVALVERAIARNGLIYASRLVHEIQEHIRHHMVPAARDFARSDAGDIAGLDRVRQSLDKLRNRIVGNAATDDIRAQLRFNVKRHLYGEASGYLAEVWADFVNDVLTPLEQAIAERAVMLGDASRAPGRAAGLAHLATDHYPDWPTDSPTAPARFNAASNEVLITTAEEYPGRYAVDVINAAERPGARFEDARDQLVGWIIEGVWPYAGEQKPPGGLVEVLRSWVPQAFAVDPATNEVQVATSAAFAVHVRPAEILNRARLLVGRSGHSFDQFCRASLRDYMRGTDLTTGAPGQVPETELQRRRQSIVQRFRQTLSLALPLATPDPEVVAKIHGVQVRYRYKFSEIPFADTDTAQDLQAVVARDPQFDTQQVTSTFQAALNQSSTARRIDVFGSYPNYAPLCFDSVVRPAVEEWQRMMGSRTSWWRMRRARPLRGAIPATDAERQAMVAGWFVGQITGKIRLPEHPERGGTVAVFDREEGTWIRFPDPMLRSYIRFRHVVDWLPVVLESMVLALGASFQTPVLDSLRPYRVLRQLYDATPEERAAAHMSLRAQTELAEWFAGRTGGRVSAIGDAASALTPDARAEVVQGYLTKWRDQNVGYFLPTSKGGDDDALFGDIADRSIASRTPLMRDLAEDIQWALAQLEGLLPAALAQSRTLPPPGPPRERKPPKSPDELRLS